MQQLGLCVDVNPITVVHANDGMFRSDFAEWLVENGHVWRRFEAEADKVWARGRKHYSARTIIEVLRHESALTDTDKTWKLNDCRTPDMARLYLLLHPSHAGFFETRVQSKSERAA